MGNLGQFPRIKETRRVAMTNRVFTNEELDEMGARIVDLITEAIEAGDNEGAENLDSRMYREFSFMQDLFIDSTAGYMDYLYKN